MRRISADGDLFAAVGGDHAKAQACASAACGADSRLSADVVDKGYLLRDRAEGCGDEYGQTQIPRMNV